MNTETHTTTPARVYVGTYAKYNNGSIAGKWLDLEDYADADDFYQACRKLHSNEHDPEIMFQDYEGFPSSYYGESFIKPELWEWLELDDDQREVVSAYRENIDNNATIEQAQDAFYGVYEDPADWAWHYLDECGYDVPDWLAGYIDYAAYARDSDMTFVETGNTAVHGRAWGVLVFSPY